MGRLVLSSATTKTDISAFVNNDNVDALLSTINGGIDGTYNLAAGAIGASGKADLAAHIAGNGLALGSNQLSVGSAVLTASNFSPTAGILSTQVSAGSVTALGANATSNLHNVVVSSTNAASGLKIVRGGLGPNVAGTAYATFGEGFSISSTGTGGYGTVSITFSAAFSTAPIIVASYMLNNFIFNLSSYPMYVTGVSTAGFTLNMLVENFPPEMGVGACFIALGT